MKSFRELIEAWPSDGRGVVGAATALAGDLGLPVASVRMWYYRSLIPADYWPKILAAAKDRGIRVSAAKLIEFQSLTTSERTLQRRPLDRKRSSARAAA